uniref:Uncharacterized protein n=1 Tax=Amphimedon queenslandica TaxID=400682 RepID=A0A1X7TDX7_AMPQE
MYTSHNGNLKGCKRHPLQLIGKERDTALIVSARGGDYETVKVLLDNGADPNIGLESEYLAPLIEAAREGHINVVELLLSKGADPNCIDQMFKHACVINLGRLVSKYHSKFTSVDTSMLHVLSIGTNTCAQSSMELECDYCLGFIQSGNGTCTKERQVPVATNEDLCKMYQLREGKKASFCG